MITLPAGHGGPPPNKYRRTYRSLGGWAVAAIAVLLLSASGSGAQAPAPSPSDQKVDTKVDAKLDAKVDAKLDAKVDAKLDARLEDGASQQAGTASPPPSQAEPQSGTGNAEKKPDGTSDDPDPLKSQEPEGRQTNRIMGVVPNFGAVNANTQLPPLSTKGKFWLATEDSFDYSSFIWTAIIAGQEFALKNYPEFGQGMAGYGRYYWHSFVDGVSGTYFTEAIGPWITHEDPRYYTLGHGGFFRRTGYALSRVILTKTDSGGTSFNWSEVGGNALEAALANAYYPPQERGVHPTLINWGAQIESAALNNVAKEWWPDVRRVLFHRR